MAREQEWKLPRRKALSPQASKGQAGAEVVAAHTAPRLQARGEGGGGEWGEMQMGGGSPGARCQGLEKVSCLFPEGPPAHSPFTGAMS